MRERTTWNRNEIQRTAAMGKKADPYLMNQDHVSQNPRADKYMNGTPSSWAEDVHTPNEWEKEYSGGATKRNEIGEPDFRSETFSHPEKTASTHLLVKKADLCVKVARQMLGLKVAEQVVEDQAVALMALPDSDLIETFQRLAQDEQGQGQEQAAPPAQQQAAQQDQGGGEQEPAQQQTQQASSYQQAAQQCMQAMQQGDQQGMMAAMQQMVQEAMKQQQGSQADFPGGQWGKNNPVASAKKKADQVQDQGGQAQQEPPVQQQAAQQMDMQAVQQMIQQAVQQQMQQQAQGGQPQQEQAPVQEQMQQEQVVQANDDALLDQMLAPAPGAEAASSIGDIELEPPQMDTGEVQLGPDDDVLKTLFATQETQDAEKAQQLQGQDKQASVVAPAPRTVGTRPTQGVSKVGGTSAPAVKTAGSDIDKLSNLWSSAPDVREHFGLK